MFAQRLVAVSGPQWGWSTPCADWTVADLVGHVVAGNQMAIELLDDGHRSRVARTAARSSGSSFQLEAQFVQTCRGQDEVFVAASPDASVAHPAGRITAREFAIYRCADIVVHAWDLARTIGATDTIDPELVEQVLAPYVGWVQTLDTAGVFAPALTGVGGESRQDDLLRRLGRSP
ncbi:MULTISPECIES: TIGR03086 family metal-binding protein [unclassified Pseudonocardia]|uniref:TIGR03086 family metal-binding protein n=1 Tax=unclassified Pseudonocardia TaxID=2619320 RepID=UPI0011AE5B8B|nr:MULTISPECIES: TIGR03086 family metal-binding protein [unclassified Pseudonocardia]